MAFKNSIVTRFALFFTSLIVFAILFVGYLVYQKSSRFIIQNSKDQLVHVSNLIEQLFNAQLNEVSNDIAVITQNTALQEYASEINEKTTQDLEHFFYSILQNKPDYFQIRFIGVDNNGLELLRLDKTNVGITKIRALQEKGNHNYFKETINLPAHSYYFSEINLNEEHGYVSVPHIPTLRVASPIFNQKNNQLAGIIVINVNLNKLYTRIDQLSNNEFSINLIDENGQYLYAPLKDKMFGLQTFSYANFFTDYNTNKTLLKNETFNELSADADLDLLSYNRSFSYYNGKRKINLVSVVNQDFLLKDALSVRQYSFLIIIAICLLTILLAWQFVAIYSKKIKLITKAISNYEHDEKTPINLPTNRNDELGQLAKTFNKMKAKIDNQVKALNKSLKKEQLAIKQKEEFLQNMSHELRTPLNTILGLSKILKDNNITDKQRVIINGLEKSATNLSGLVYDVLDHRKITEGNLKLKHAPVNLTELLKSIHTTYQYEALRKKIKFSLHFENIAKDTFIETDELRLTQIITNLIINALKYTNHGEIILNASISENSNTLLNISIKDTGIGIDKEGLQNINARNFVADENITGRYGSYGLGLTIVKQLTQLFKGSLSATSQKNQGSEFKVSIPTTIVTQQENSSPQNTQLPYLKSKKYVLHIEDDVVTADMVKFALQKDLIELSQISALTDLKTEDIDKADLIISDVMLEDSAIDTAELKKLKQKPLLLVSAINKEKLKALHQYVLQKPFDIDLLQDYVHWLLLTNSYASPNFSQVYQSYDLDPKHINRFLQLIEKEFEIYVKRINQAFESKNQKEWDAILHKIITHIKSYELKTLDALLPSKVAQLNPSTLEEITNVFNYYLCYIRVQKQINSID